MSSKLPRFLRKPELRPTLPPVEVGYDRYCDNAKPDKLDRGVDCLGAISDERKTANEETKLTRLAELTVADLRKFGIPPTHLGAGLYGSESEGTLKRQSLSSKPSIWSVGIRVPIANRVSKGASTVSWGWPNIKSAEDSCRLLGEFPIGVKIDSPNVCPMMPNLKPDQKNPL